MNANQAFNIFYYRVKPFLPRKFQIWVRSLVVKIKLKKFSTCWPIFEAAGRQPENWQSWPKQKRMAVVLTHDVESERGLANCRRIAQLESTLGFRSSFNFVVQRYQVPDLLRYELESKGFEIGVHGVYHDGRLFQSRDIFRQRAKVINHYLKKWNCVGFRSPSMHHNLQWLHDLKISYDLSTFDTDPFEPQADGVSTIFPFWVGQSDNKNRYLEMPYTLSQDFTLFILMKERNTQVWKEKLDWIFHHGGMALLNTHPDYMSFEGDNIGAESYPVDYYLEFLSYIKSEYQGQYWHGLPKHVAQYYSGKIYRSGICPAI